MISKEDLICGLKYVLPYLKDNSCPKDIEPEVWEEKWEHVFDLLDHL